MSLELCGFPVELINDEIRKQYLLEIKAKLVY